jgi:hypothetical protein
MNMDLKHWAAKIFNNQAMSFFWYSGVAITRKESYISLVGTS